MVERDTKVNKSLDDLVKEERRGGDSKKLKSGRDYRDEREDRRRDGRYKERSRSGDRRRGNHLLLIVAM